MTVIKRYNDGIETKLDDGHYPVFKSPFYSHPDFGKTVVGRGEVYSHHEVGERGDANVERSKLSLISLPPTSDLPYPYLFDLLWIGGPSSEDIKRLYKEVQE